MKNWALLLASVIVATSAITLRAQVDQGTDMGGGDNGAVDAGGDQGGAVAGGGFQQGGGGGRGGRGGGGGGGAGRGGGRNGGNAGNAGNGGNGFANGGGGGLGGGGGRNATGFAGGGQGTGTTGGGGGFAGGGGGGGRGTNNLQNIQIAISSPDEEWTVLLPFVQSLVDAQTLGNVNTRAMMGGGGGGGRGGRGGGGGGFGNTQNAIDPATNPVGAAFQELQTAIQDPSSSDELLRIRLKNYRDARDKVKNVLAKAQESVREFLTLRQEAIMINLGYLE